MTKKYYWLKLKNDFFNQKEIKKLRRIAGGDTFTIIYLKMQLFSIKTEGIISFEGTEENLAEQLALELDEDVDNVKLTLSFLNANNLIEQVNKEDFLLNKVLEVIGSETESAERVRRFRDKKKGQKALQCNDDVTKSNTEIEIEIDKSKNKYYYENEINNIRKVLPKEMTKNASSKPKLIKAIKEHGEEKIINSIKAYNKYVQDERKKGFKELRYCNEQTFWNGRYIDYLDNDSVLQDNDKKFQEPIVVYEEVEYE